MTNSVIIALGLLTIVNRSLALSCLPCEQTDWCTTPSCSYGWTKDVCACCDVCAKGPGEVCGGPWGISGRCSTPVGLICQKNLPDDFNSDGICVYDWSEPKDACIRQHNDLILTGLHTLEICKEKCIEHNDFCRSVEYDASIHGQCVLSHLTSTSEAYVEPCYIEGWIFTEIQSDECGILSPPGFWISVYFNSPPCPEGSIATPISRPGGQCCQEEPCHVPFCVCGANEIIIGTTAANGCPSCACEPCPLPLCICGTNEIVIETTADNGCPLCACGVWSEPIDACIRQNNDLILTGVHTLEICKEMCIAHAADFCRSVEYEEGINKRCVLSHLTSSSEAYVEPCYIQGWLFTEIQSESCTLPYEKVGFQCLYIGQNPLLSTWQDAQERCQNMKGNLAEVTEVQNTVIDFLKSKAGDLAWAWVARTSENNSDQWLTSQNPVRGRWIEVPVTPSDGCLKLGVPYGGGYKQYNCRNSLRDYLCEKILNVIP